MSRIFLPCPLRFTLDLSESMRKIVRRCFTWVIRVIDRARNLLEPFREYLQSDGYVACNDFEGKEGVCLVDCLAHIRRHYEISKEGNKSQAEYVLAKMQELYRIEQVTDIQGDFLKCECRKDRNRLSLFLTSWNNGWKQPIRECFLKAE